MQGTGDIDEAITVSGVVVQAHAGFGCSGCPGDMEWPIFDADRTTRR
jgi:hypothetical protein